MRPWAPRGSGWCGDSRRRASGNGSEGAVSGWADHKTKGQALLDQVPSLTEFGRHGAVTDIGEAGALPHVTDATKPRKPFKVEGEVSQGWLAMSTRQAGHTRWPGQE